MASLRLEVVTPDAMVVSSDVDYVAVPGVEGQFGVLPGHIPFLSGLAIGGLHYQAEGKTKQIFVAGGFAEVSNNVISVLAEAAEAVEKIDVTRAREAKIRAEKRLEEGRKGEGSVDMRRAELALQRAINRLSLVMK